MRVSGDDPIVIGVPHRSWFLQVIAGQLEVVWANGLKYTEGFTCLWHNLATLAAMAISCWLIGAAMKTLPVGTAYAVWVGVGAVGTVISRILLFNQPASVTRIVSVLLIVAGIVGLKLSSPP